MGVLWQEKEDEHHKLCEKGIPCLLGIKLGDLDRKRAPKKVCHTYVEQLRKWSQGKKISMPFPVSVIWHEPRNLADDCYFCVCDVAGYNSKNLKNIVYPNLLPAKRTVAHLPGFPVSSPSETFGNESSYPEIKSEDNCSDSDPVQKEEVK